MRKGIKILGKVFSVAVLLLIILPMVLSLLLDIPAVQNYVVQKAVRIVSKTLETTVSIDRVDIGLFSKVKVKGFYVEDYQRDTLLYVGKIDAYITGLGIFGGGVVFSRGEISGAKLYLRETPEGEMNIKQIVNRISDPDKPRKGNFRLSLRKASIEGMDLCLERLTRRDPEFGIDFGHMHLYGITAHVSDFTIDGQSIYTTIEAMSARERSGFVLDHFSGRFYLTNGALGFEDTSVVTPRSNVDIPYISLVGDSWAGYKDFLGEVRLDGRLRNSTVSTDDIAYFAPRLRGWHTVFSNIDIEVAGVVKAVSSLPEIVRVYEESGVKFIATSRISQMRAIREAGICKKPLMLIRIPMLSELPDVVELCDISLQSDIIVLRALNEEAKKQGKVHEVILMMDLGDLREGFWNEEDALDAALEIEHELKNLRLAGVGVNLSCYGSVLPTKRNMQGLVSLASDIEREIGRKLDYISGGASTSAYMAMNGTMPYRINLLRLGDIGLRGETDNFAPDFLETGVMTIKAEVIECRDKPSFPVGELSVNAFGEVGHYEDRGIRRRALVAMGRVDYGNCFDLIPRMEGIEVIGASSDHTILDVEAVKDKVHVGDVLEFGIKAYGPMAYLTSSDGVHMVFKGGKQNA